MSLVAAPYGLQPISSQVGIPRPLRMPLGIASGYAANIFKYSAVTLVPATGVLNAVTNPGGVPQGIFGIFAGVEYTPVGGRPAVSPFWASGTVYDPTYDMFVYLWPAWTPDTRFRVQADGSVAQPLMGQQFNITNPAAGNTATGLGACTVGAAGIGQGAQGQFALIEFDNGINETPGDAFTDLVVTIALPQIGFGPQPSIG